MISFAELRDTILALAGSFDVALLSPDDAMEVLEHVTAIDHVMSALGVQLSARVAESDGWRATGAASASEWVARTTGVTMQTARERVVCGRRLRELGPTREAALSGQLSVEQVTAITDAATVMPAAEFELLDAAGVDSLGELRDRCLQAKARADGHLGRTRERIHVHRGTRTWIDKEGAFHLHLRTTADQGAPIDAELDRLVNQQFELARAEGRRESYEAYKTDALAVMADRSRTADTPTTTRKKGKRAPVRYLAVLRADLSALTRGQVANGEVCEIAGLGPVPVAVARDLLGEAVLHLVLTRGRDANVTHLGRGANAAQRVTLLWRSPICQVLGCGRRARLEIDHREDYRYTRHTTLEELEPLCHADHQRKTRDGWSLVAGTGKRPFVPPDDRRHPRYKPPPTAGAAPDP